MFLTESIILSIAEMDTGVGEISSKITTRLPISFETRHILSARTGQTTIPIIPMDLRILRQIFLPGKIPGYAFRSQAPQ